MNYSAVQFISWEIYTGPTITHRYDDGRSEGYYLGLVKYGPNDRRTGIFLQYQDIKARVEFTKNAISKASEKANTEPSVLKIFMAPEFLYRGPVGAYLHDLINGWKNSPHMFLPNQWPGLFGELKNIVADDKYKDWLFVFGTAISASSFRVHDNGILNIDDISRVYNSCLIQLGGTGNGANNYVPGENYVSRKHYVSGIDFLNYYRGQPAHTMGSITPADSQILIPSDVLGVTEGGALFNITTEGRAAFIIKDVNDHNGNSIRFGIEICLDHARSGGNGTNLYGRLKTAGQRVRIQLVPSAGMDLDANSIFLQEPCYSYAFNCDGLNGGINCPSHTQICNTLDTNNMNILFNSNNQDATCINTVCCKIDRFSSFCMDTDLWTYGSGSVRIVNPLPLN